VSPADGGAPLSYPHTAPPFGIAVPVTPGVRWLRMPLPFRLDHINLWLLEDGDGWAIVDTGIADERTKELWLQLFTGGLDGRPITRVIITHFHPDHIGLAGWLTEHWRVKLWITESEFMHALLASAPDATLRLGGVDNLYKRIGLDAAAREPFQKHVGGYRKLVGPVPVIHQRLEGGQNFRVGGRDWQVVIGRGHAPEHACLYCPELDLLIAGDQVLPKISPHIGVSFLEPEGDNLGRYLTSLAAVRAAVPMTAFVLPSHGLPFYGLHRRIDQLIAHHEERIDQIVAGAATPGTAVDLMPFLFTRALDPHESGFALGETLAHLHYAVATGRLVRDERPDGAWLFSQS
jgi:glyoxylase-like metal-dependent hydrolase (beta-lactamase superfamily II)